MILSDTEILNQIKKKTIVIRPFQHHCLGSNSYDVHLSPSLLIYQNQILDSKTHNRTQTLYIPQEGMILWPDQLYLGVTVEYTETLAHVPFLEGKSSLGRLGIDIHSTAGKGDVGYKNTWTLEISVKKPVRIYPFMPIGQIIYFQIMGTVSCDYSHKRSAKYKSISKLPVESKMYLNFSQNPTFPKTS